MPRAAHTLTIRNVEHRSARSRDHRRRWTIEHLVQDLRFERSERGLTLVGEDLGHGAAGLRLDGHVAVEERSPQPLGQHPTDCGLACAHHSDQYQVPTAHGWALGSSLPNASPASQLRRLAVLVRRFGDPCRRFLGLDEEALDIANELATRCRHRTCV